MSTNAHKKQNDEIEPITEPKTDEEFRDELAERYWSFFIKIFGPPAFLVSIGIVVWCAYYATDGELGTDVGLDELLIAAAFDFSCSLGFLFSDGES